MGLPGEFSLHKAGTWPEATAVLYSSMGRGFLNILIRKCPIGDIEGKRGQGRQAAQESF